MILLEIPPYGKTYDLTYPAARATLYQDLKNDGFFDLEWGKKYEPVLSQEAINMKQVNEFLNAVLDFIKLKYGKPEKAD